RALVCVDDEYGKRLSADLALPIATCSALAEDGSDFWAADVRTEGLLGCHYRWHLPNQDCSVSLPLAGSFAVINSLLAGTAAYLLGVPTDGILCALEGMNPIPGRMETVQLGAHADVCAVIDYAHTPDALEQLLRSVRQARKGDGRILLLFGCGGDRDRSKRRQMGQIASRLSDFVIITSDNARGEDPVAILDEIEKGLDKEKPYIRIEDRETAIREAVSLCQSGDILVLAGKGHETYEIDATGKHPFDEKEIVRRAWKQRGHRTGRTDEYEDQCRM
ncbi:MAG: UDP-N-acetylmuramoyl-L-alanyl-D-glutamate--2,6-diaminopimelate ligase, partial [Clostridia bacterium]|nr:UDP-N-acetylmuramoyl-L-alanyl-D-glutamate--2,6-diaminopimelate ligase [Clostridia bacterium]